MTLPVFELNAEHVYHSKHSATNRIVCTVGVVNRGIANGFGEGDRDGTGAWTWALKVGLPFELDR